MTYNPNRKPPGSAGGTGGQFDYGHDAGARARLDGADLARYEAKAEAEMDALIRKGVPGKEKITELRELRDALGDAPSTQDVENFRDQMYDIGDDIDDIFYDSMHDAWVNQDSDEWEDLNAQRAAVIDYFSDVAITWEESSSVSWDPDEFPFTTYHEDSDAMKHPDDSLDEINEAWRSQAAESQWEMDNWR